MKSLSLCRATISLAALLLGASSGYLKTAAAQDSSAPDRQTIESRLRRLEDREEIRTVIMEYGRRLDRRDFAAFSQLFADNGGEWIGGMGKAKGPDAIRKLMEDSIGKGKGGINSPNLHLLTNEIIQVKGDQATALTKWIFVVQGAENRPQLVYVGHYDDTFIREKRRWKFERRVVYSDIPHDDPLAPK